MVSDTPYSPLSLFDETRTLPVLTHYLSPIPRSPYYKKLRIRAASPKFWIPG